MSKREKILSLIREVTGKDLSPSDGESLFESGTLDSFALPDLVTALEGEFGVKIPDSDLNPRKFDSIERIDQYLTAKGA
ncbi:MAG: acyl carrier protein [Bryobacterales bacterium]|nr:acyl carrier protein [Bryobacterales bacterium]